MAKSMNTERTWHDLEVYSPVMHRRYFYGWKEKILLQFAWQGFFFEPLFKPGCAKGQIVVYIQLR